MTGGEVKLFAGERDDALPNDPVWSPDGKQVAFVRVYSHFNLHLVTKSSSGGEERDFGNVCFGRPAWSPDGRFLVASRMDEDSTECYPTVYSTATGQAAHEFGGHGDDLVISPDGRALAYADDKDLKLIPLGHNCSPVGPAATLIHEMRQVSNLLWARDGQNLFYEVSGNADRMKKVAIQSDAVSVSIPGLDSDVTISQILSDGRAIATESVSTEALWRADLQSAPIKLETIPDTGCALGWPACSPDGRKMAFATDRSGAWELWLSNADGTEERPLVQPVPLLGDDPDDDASVPRVIGWSPNGNLVAFTTFAAHGNADLRSYLYVVSASGGPARRLATEADAIDNPVWTRDGKALIGSCGWPVEDQAHARQSPLVRIEVADGKITDLRADGMWPQLSPDGEVLYFFTSPRPKLSRIPAQGGIAERLRDQEDLVWYSYAVGSKYVYVFQEPVRDAKQRIYSLLRFEPQARQTTKLAEIPFDPRSARLSPDQRFLYIQQSEVPKRRVVLITGLN